MYQKDKSESYLMNNCLSGTMSLGANLLSIFVPSYFLTVTYPELKTMDDIHTQSEFTSTVTKLWDKLPMFRDNKYKVPVLHVPNNKVLITKALNDTDLRVSTKTKAGDYCFQ